MWPFTKGSAISTAIDPNITSLDVEIQIAKRLLDRLSNLSCDEIDALFSLVPFIRYQALWPGLAAYIVKRKKSEDVYSWRDPW